MQESSRNKIKAILHPPNNHFYVDNSHCVALNFVKKLCVHQIGSCLQDFCKKVASLGDFSRGISASIRACVKSRTNCFLSAVDGVLERQEAKVSFLDCTDSKGKQHIFIIPWKYSTIDIEYVTYLLFIILSYFLARKYLQWKLLIVGLELENGEHWCCFWVFPDFNLKSWAAQTELYSPPLY